MSLFLKQLQSLATRAFHTSACTSSSVFMKKQKKVDPEIAKIREARKRKRLEREIFQIKKHSKRPKPVEEMTIDVTSAKNITERYREPFQIPEEIEDERIIIKKQYGRSRNALMLADDKWICRAISRQQRALAVLRNIDPKLYEAAIQVDPTFNNFVIHGPSLTPPIEDYECPDGEYIDTTRNWVY